MRMFDVAAKWYGYTDAHAHGCCLAVFRFVKSENFMPKMKFNMGGHIKSPP